MEKEVLKSDPKENKEKSFPVLPHVAVSDEASAYILKRSSSVILSRSVKAGRYGYPADALTVECKKPADSTQYVQVVENGITFYIDAKMSVENYEQINVWLRSNYVVIKTLKARVTLYRRIKL